MVVGIQILTFAIILSLVLLTSRKKSNIAKWLLVILFAIGLLAILAQPGLILANGITSIIGIIQTLIQAAAVLLPVHKRSSGLVRIKGLEPYQNH